MRIFKVTQESWNGGKVSDFDLPRVLDHVTSEIAAELRIVADMHRPLTGKYWTSRDDYHVMSIDVMGKRDAHRMKNWPKAVG